MKQEYRHTALAMKVLAVASVKYRDEEGKDLFDWAVYIDAVEGQKHGEEFMKVATHGSKQPKKIAVLLFPDLDPEKYRR